MQEHAAAPADPLALNRESYDRIAARWDAARSAFHGREAVYLDLLLTGLAAGADVLDLGCGTGRPMAEAALARGHRVVGVDQSRELLARAAQRFPGAAWIEADITASDLASRVPPGPYAAALCWDALFHLPRALHEPLAAAVAAMLAPGGRFMITAGGSANHPAFTDTMFDATFFYDSHAPDETVALLARAGFRTLLVDVMNAPDGQRDKGRIAIVAEKAA
jgi:cyclopropane fatty-acyl-phospholipid synthase-like methyltransferase